MTVSRRALFAAIPPLAALGLPLGKREAAVLEEAKETAAKAAERKGLEPLDYFTPAVVRGNCYAGYFESLLLFPDGETKRGLAFVSDRILFPEWNCARASHLTEKPTPAPLPIVAWRYAGAESREEGARLVRAGGLWDQVIILPGGRIVRNGSHRSDEILKAVRMTHRVDPAPQVSLRVDGREVARTLTEHIPRLASD